VTSIQDEVAAGGQLNARGDERVWRQRAESGSAETILPMRLPRPNEGGSRFGMEQTYVRVCPGAIYRGRTATSKPPAAVR
jgi:hypothetical protein